MSDMEYEDNDLDSAEELEDNEDDDDRDDHETPLNKDLFAYAWLKVTKSHNQPLSKRLHKTLASIGIVVFIFLLQFVLCYCLFIATVAEGNSEFKQLVATFNDAVGNMGNAGLPTLSTQDAKEICGDYGDDYNDNALGTSTFSYKKMPNSNWNVFDIPSGSRSILDDAIFVYTALSRYSCVFLCVATLWVLALLMEAEDIFTFCVAITTCDSITTKSKRLGSLGAISHDIMYAKIMGVFIVIVRTMVLIALALSGCYLLIRTHDIVDIVLNSVALVFVVQIDEWLLPVFARSRVGDELSETRMEHEGSASYRPILACIRCFRPCKFWWALIVGVLGAVVMRGIQLGEAEETFYLAASLCLFAGPTPDITKEYRGGFPVPGVCETLLELECSLPARWKADQCLRSQPSSFHPACQFYQNPVTVSPAQQPPPYHLSPPTDPEKKWSDPWIKERITSPYEAWRQRPHGDEFCKLANGNSVSSFEKPSLGGWLQDPKDILEHTCLSMWSEHPALEVNFTYSERWPHAYSYRFASIPRNFPHNGFVPFPRLRNYARGDSRFSAPLQCSSDVVNALLLSSGNPATPAQVITNWGSAAEKLPGCTKPLVVSANGAENALCDSYYVCDSGLCAFSDPNRFEVHRLDEHYNYGSVHTLGSPMAYNWGRCQACPPQHQWEDSDSEGEFVNYLKKYKVCIEHNGGFYDRHCSSVVEILYEATDVARTACYEGRHRKEAIRISAGDFLNRVTGSLTSGGDCNGWSADYAAEDNVFFYKHDPTNIMLMPIIFLRNLTEPSFYHEMGRRLSQDMPLTFYGFFVHTGASSVTQLPRCDKLGTKNWVPGTETFESTGF